MSKITDRAPYIVLEALERGATVMLDGYEHAMDEAGDIGVVMEKNGERLVMGDRLTVGHLFKLARGLPESEIAVLAAGNALTKTKRSRRHEHKDSAPAH